MEKNELLADLYSIRAGMSYISQKRDDVQTKKEAVNKRETVIEDFTKEKNDIKKEIEELKKNKVKNTSAAKSETQINKELEKNINDNHPFGCLVAIITFLVTPALFGVVGSFVFTEEFPGYYWFIMVASTVVLSFIAMIIYFVKASHSDEKLAKYIVENEKNEIKSKNAQIDSIIKLKERRMAEIGGSVQKEYQQKNNSEAEYTALKAVKEKESREIYNAMVESFAPTLDPRDWESVDLLIYYFETGRAETLKESLQLLDRERQTNTVVTSIIYASQTISQEIRLGLQKIHTEIRRGFNKIDSQLTTQNDILFNINDTQQSISQGLHEINENEKMQTALLAKINVSSKKLAEDVDYMIYRK